MQIKKIYLKAKEIDKLKTEVNKFCKRTGLSKRLLAENLKMSPSGLGNYLSGRTKLGQDMAIKICSEIGLAPTHVVGPLTKNMQVHQHRFKMSAPINKQTETTLFIQNPGIWELVEVDEPFNFHGREFSVNIRANSKLMIVGLEHNDDLPFASDYVLYAAHEKSGFEFLTAEEFQKKPKGYKTLHVAGFTWKRI